MHCADLYLDKIDYLQYLPRTDCSACGVKTCEAFLRALRQGSKKPCDCPVIPPSLHTPFQIALEAENILPRIPALTVPRPSQSVGLIEINQPDQHSPILISGNNIHTQDVLTSMLATTKSGFFLVFIDTKGDTVDMAIIYQTLTAEQVKRGVLSSGILNRVTHQAVILPGLAAAIRDGLKESTGWHVTIGPVCAAELPLFFGDRWLPMVL